MLRFKEAAKGDFIRFLWERLAIKLAAGEPF
jgi:hypothetical protein